MKKISYLIFLTYLFKFNTKKIIGMDYFGDISNDDWISDNYKQLIYDISQDNLFKDDFDKLYDDSITNTFKTLDYCLENKIDIVSIFDENYPQNLKTLKDPPIVLYSKGDISILNTKHSIAVVGTRKPTLNGNKAALRFGSFIGEKNIIVVSGLAIGCDTQAHVGCIDAGGQTVAVLASGLDKIYPKENSKLAAKILDTGGCLISEYPPKYKTTKVSFVKRDRIESGISNAVIIVEAPLKSGTMHTAQYAQDQKKLLGAYLHSYDYFELEEAEGNKLLINTNKAIPLRSSSDIIDFIYRSANINCTYSESLFDFMETKDNLELHITKKNQRGDKIG